MKIPIFKHKAIQPLKSLGLTDSFWDINIDTLIYTWIAMVAIFLVVAATSFYYKRKKINPFSYAIEQMIEFFVNLCRDSFGFFQYDYFSFVMSLFIFVFICNSIGMLPFIKEPTEDVNTALACGISSFIYVQLQKIKVHGLLGYFKEFFEPIKILFPLNVIGEFSKILSMSFRLFGNILGGSIIIMIALQSIEPYKLYFMGYVAVALPLLWLVMKKINLENYPLIKLLTTINYLVLFCLAWLLMFVGLFEGIVQAFVITMLTITFLALIGKKETKKPAQQESPAQQETA